MKRLVFLIKNSIIINFIAFRDDLNASFHNLNAARDIFYVQEEHFGYCAPYSNSRGMRSSQSNNKKFNREGKERKEREKEKKKKGYSWVEVQSHTCHIGQSDSQRTLAHIGKQSFVRTGD